MSPQESIAVRAIIINHDNEVFMGQRTKNPGAGQLSLFGGKPEPTDQSLEDATIREVEEETGYRIKITDLVAQTLDLSTTPETPWKVFFYAAQIIGGKYRLKTTEHSTAGWFSRKKLIDQNIAFNHREVLNQFFNSPATKITVSQF